MTTRTQNKDANSLATRKRLVVSQVKAALTSLNEDQLTQVSDSFQRELQRVGYVTRRDPEFSPLLQAIQDEIAPIGFPYQAAEQDQLVRDVLAESFRQRHALLEGAMSASEVSKLLDVSRQTPLNRIKKGTLLAIYENGTWLFPRWQFDPQGSIGVIEGLPRVLQSLNVSPIEKLNWFLRRSPYLENRTPKDALILGEVDRVAELARSVGAL